MCAALCDLPAAWVTPAPILSTHGSPQGRLLLRGLSTLPNGGWGSQASKKFV